LLHSFTEHGAMNSSLPTRIEPEDDTGGGVPIVERVDAELTRLLHDQDIPGLVTNLCAAALVAWLHWKTGEMRVLWAWVGAWVAANVAYLVFILFHRRQGRARIGSFRWRRAHLLVSNVLSVSAAGFMPWFFSPTPEWLYLNTTLVLIYFAGIYASNAMISPASFLFAGATVLLPLVALHLWLGTRGSLAIAAASILFYGALIPFAKVQAGALRQAIRVGFENEELARNLARQTERAEAARREAEEANRAKARFLAAATHDLRQPLHALSLTLETLPHPEPGAPSSDPIDRARECTRQLSGMFDALLDQAQLDAGTRAIHVEPVPLAALFAQIESQFSHQAQSRGLWLRCRPTVGVVMADRLALWRIASNLVTNALEATAQGGVLVAWRAHRRTLEVRDSGRGIAADDHETVFEEFRRLPEASRNARGLGLGLATVRRLAHLMGATVTLRSAPGRGSVFSLCFPPEAVTATPAAGTWIPQADPAPRVSVRALPGARVLAVDDDPAILAAIEALLGQWGFEVRVAADCVAAAAQVGGDWIPGLMIFDRRLPDGDGAAMAATLRGRLHPAPACLIITGDTAPDDLLALRGSGFDVLHKPVSPAQLLTALGSLGMLAQSPKDAAAPRAPA